MSLAHTYAAVLKDAEGKKLGKPFAEKILSYMKAKGHLSLLPHILRIAERSGAKDGAVVHIAKHADVAKYKHEIADALKVLAYSGDHDTVEDSRIVGGYTVRAKGKVIDNSFRSALVSLYRSIVRS
jgi:F0F1-type ATP synthase delta subunit